jgi:hypothetical protein
VLPRRAEEQLASWREEVLPLLAALDQSLPSLVDATPAVPAGPVPSTTFLALHAEMTMVSASGTGLRW